MEAGIGGKAAEAGWPTAVAAGSLVGAGVKVAGSKGDASRKATGACEFKGDLGGFQNLLRIRDH